MSDTPTPIAAAELCRWCGTMHGVKCPIVKAIEYDTRGRVRRVKFMTPADQMPWFPVAPQPPPPQIGQWTIGGIGPAREGVITVFGDGPAIGVTGV